MIRDDIILEDTTLRDGEQSPGVAFCMATKVRILDELIKAGVRWAEVGIPVMGGQELDTMKVLLERKDEAHLVGWNRGVKEDVKLSLDTGFNAVHIGLPTSKLHLKDSINKNRSWLMDKAADLIKYAKDRGAFVSISAEDIGRTEIGFLQEYAVAVAEAGADRLRLSDTIGILTPTAYAERVRKVVESADIDTQCHTHNDFGLATANTLAGLEAGARYFHVTVNAIGERAGMSDIVQVVFALKYLYGHDLGLDGQVLKRLADFVAQTTGKPLPPWHPVTGNNVFAHESGIHVHGMLNNKKAFEPFPPESVGGNRAYIIGKHSGRATLAHHLENEGIQCDESILSKCLEQVRDLSIAKEGAVSVGELKKIYREVCEPSHAPC